MVDLLLVNGESVDFAYPVRDGDRISVYPVFESLDIAAVTRVRPEPLRELRFVLDVHLGRLAAYLRLAGFDTVYRNDRDDAELAGIAAGGRVLLTRDQGLLKRRAVALDPLIAALTQAADRVRPCGVCGNLDTTDPCALCGDARRDESLICVVEDVADLWALERGAIYRGRYHVLGGVLSALDGVGPEDLHIAGLVERARAEAVKEVIVATSATVDGQTTAHYITDRLAGCGVVVSHLAHGVPMGGELEYLDDGTLAAALKARRPY